MLHDVIYMTLSTILPQLHELFHHLFHFCITQEVHFCITLCITNKVDEPISLKCSSEESCFDACYKKFGAPPSKAKGMAAAGAKKLAGFLTEGEFCFITELGEFLAKGKMIG